MDASPAWSRALDARTFDSQASVPQSYLTQRERHDLPHDRLVEPSRGESEEPSFLHRSANSVIGREACVDRSHQTRLGPCQDGPSRLVYTSRSSKRAGRSDRHARHRYRVRRALHRMMDSLSHRAGRVKGHFILRVVRCTVPRSSRPSPRCTPCAARSPPELLFAERAEPSVASKPFCL